MHKIYDFYIGNSTALKYEVYKSNDRLLDVF